MRSLTALTLVAALAACGGSGSDLPADAGDAPDGAAPDATPPDPGPLFAPDHIAEVEIAIAPADWDALRVQTRTMQTILEGDCLAQPIPSPFTTFPGDVTIDGTRIANVGLHKKGFLGSLSDTKPGLKVTFDEYVPGQRYLGLKKLTLNNAHQDPSYVRQCLTYGVFGAAGVPAPRCNFAHVRVNGADLGLYVNVETVDHDFTRRVFGTAGNVYEGSLSDFRTSWVNTFDPKTGGDGRELQPIVDALALPDDAAMVAALAPHLDLDAFDTYWAMEVITAHWDGYANDKNNFYVYADPATGALAFVPWGVDATFQPDHAFGDPATGPNAVAASGLLARRLFDYAPTRAAFLARERALLDTVWNEGALHAELDRMEALIAPIADAVGDPGWRGAVDQVRAFVDGRRAVLAAELDAGPTWTYPLAGYPCLDVAAAVSGTFTTTYGTIGAANPLATGGGTMAITIGGATTTLGPIGATSGLDPSPTANPATQLVEVFGVRADGHVIVALFSVPVPWFVPWGFDVGFFGVAGAVYDFDPAANAATYVGMVLGRLDLAQASATPGAPVSGSFHGNADVQGTPPAFARPALSPAVLARLRDLRTGP